MVPTSVRLGGPDSMAVEASHVRLSGRKAVHRAAVLRSLERTDRSKPTVSVDANRLARRVAAAGRVGLVTGAAIAGTAAIAPPAQALTSGRFCPITGGYVELHNPAYNTTPWTCIRYQQRYDIVSTVEGTATSGAGQCVGITSSGNVDPRHLSDMPYLYGRDACGGYAVVCSETCRYTSGHPFIKDAGGDVGFAGFSGYVNYNL